MDSLVVFAEWRRWMQATGLSEETVRTYTYSVLKFLSGSPRPIENYSEGHVIEFLALLGRRAAAKDTYYRAIRSFFGWARERDYIAADPSALLKTRKPRSREPDAFTVDEVQALALAAFVRNRRRASAILLCYGLGARRGELCALRWQDVDFENGIVKFEFTKGDHPRAVPISRPAREALEELRDLPRTPWQKNPDLVLGGIDPTTFNAWVHQAAVECGLPPGRRNAHKLRASYATHLLNRGVPIHVVSKLLGHSDVAITTRYASVRDDQRRDAVAML